MGRTNPKTTRSVLAARDGQVTARFLIVANNNGVRVPEDVREQIYAAEEQFREKTTPHWGAHMQQAAAQPFARLAVKPKPALVAVPVKPIIMNRLEVRSTLAARDEALVSNLLRVLRSHGLAGTKDLKPVVLEDLRNLRTHTTPNWGTHIKRADRQPFPQLLVDDMTRRQAQKAGHKPATMTAANRRQRPLTLK